MCMCMNLCWLGALGQTAQDIAAAGMEDGGAARLAGIKQLKGREVRVGPRIRAARQQAGWA